jgi:hypothetical protein
MPTKTSYTTAERLLAVPLPNHGGRYSIVSHGHIISESKSQLAQSGFTIDKEFYKMSLDGQMAQGIYHIKHGNDPDMGLMFAWSNSYNKMMRFKCAIGAHVFICSNGVVSGDMASYARKHSGTALYDVNNHIQSQISRANEYFTNLIADKEMLKQVVLTREDQASIVGKLLLDKEVLTLTQVGIIKREMDKPSYSYSADPNSAWSLYNHITLALKESHPLHYIKDHQLVHGMFVNAFGQLVTPQVTNQDDDDEEEEEYEVEKPEPVAPAAGSDFDIDATSTLFGVNFL